MRLFLMSHYLRHDNLIFIMVRTYNRHSCDFAGQESIFAELSVETIRKMSVSCFLQERFSIVIDRILYSLQLFNDTFCKTFSLNIHVILLVWNFIHPCWGLENHVQLKDDPPG